MSGCWHHGVGSVCLVMILCWTISANSFSISSLYSMGTFHLPCWTGGTVGSVLMSYSPCMSLMQSKLLGYRAWDGPWYCWWSLIWVLRRWGWHHDPGGGGPLDGCSVTFRVFLPWLGIWNDSSHLVSRHHVSGIKFVNPVYNGPKRSVFLRAILNGLGGNLFVHILRLCGLFVAGFRFFGTFSGWLWKGTFTWLVTSMEVTHFRGVCWWFRLTPLSCPWFCRLSVVGLLLERVTHAVLRHFLNR